MVDGCSGSTSPGDGLKSIHATAVGNHPEPTVCCHESVNPRASQENLARKRIGWRARKAHARR
jgi:hypothetical protein